jgi:hypothetical protein
MAGESRGGEEKLGRRGLSRTRDIRDGSRQPYGVILVVYSRFKLIKGPVVSDKQSQIQVALFGEVSENVPSVPVDPLCIEVHSAIRFGGVPCER